MLDTLQCLLLLIISFTPGGSMSTPALMTSKHCSSGTGFDVHLSQAQLEKIMMASSFTHVNIIRPSYKKNAST